ncbi:protein panoramix [Musca domestica]|uniref:Protein panoramix n=1 Tax=Musca domestica TaxID=7370 RepID=A0A9J7CZX9_MUSDO|nr:protein panoramix [Musca domestica]
MSETTPIKSEPEEDEENGRVTPVRKSVQEYEQSLQATEGGDGAETLVAPSINKEEQETITNAKEKDMKLQFNHTSPVTATEDLSQVIVKHEPQDLADLEQTMARIDGATNDETNEDDRATPLPGNNVESDRNTITDNTNQHPPPTPPRISVLSTSLLRVKPEFSAAMHTMQDETPAEYSSLPQDFFDGIMSDDIPDTPAAVPIIEPKKETIPSDFFDDLLVDKIQERVEAAETQDLEIKFSDRLKQLEELERRLAKEKKKHKKSKKKSRKRDRSPSHSPRRHGSRSPTPTQRRHKSRSRSPIKRRYTRSPSPSRRRLASRSPSPSDRRSRKIMRWPQESQVEDRMDAPSTSRRSHEYRAEDKRRIKTEAEKPPGRASPEDVEFNEDELSENMQPHLPELGGEITVKQKRDRVIVRAKTLLNYLKVSEMEKDRPLSTFLYTSIVRKLPASHSYRNQHIYENRSPLHNVNNVSYKFNSHIRRFNLEEWGLASLPPVAANVAKLVGCDAQAIHNQLKVIKIPAKIRKIKGEPLDEDEEAELLQSGSSLFCNAFTQTDDVVDIVQHKSQGFDIEIQAVPQTFDIACQTLETESPSSKLYDNNDDLPIMAIMREMNDSQLMALHDFAELLKETASNAMDMYRLRQRMLDIYKSAQQPSALDPSPSVPPAAAAVVPTGVNRYSSNESSPSSRIRHTDKSSGFRINSVEGGDGTYFSVNDPRGNFVGSRNRNGGGGGQFNRNMNNRNMVPSESHRDFNNPQRNQQSANAPKFYGRGGLRR